MFQVRVVETIPSTQKEMLSRLRRGETQAGDVLLAHQQSDGQGRRGRSWLSSGEALALSMAIPKSWVLPAQGPVLPSGQLVVHALLEALRAWLPPAQAAFLGWKWPNDLVLFGAAPVAAPALDSSGPSPSLRKVGGILVDELHATIGPDTGPWQIIGLGLNARLAPACLQDPVAVPAGGLLDGLPAHCQIHHLLPFLLEALAKVFRPTTSHALIRSKLEASMAYLGQEVVVWDDEIDRPMATSHTQRLMGLGPSGEALLPAPTQRGRLRLAKDIVQRQA